MSYSYLKRSTYNTLMYSLTGVSSKALSFIALPYFLSHLSLTAFGELEWYQNLFSLGIFLLGSCASTALTRFALLHKDNVTLQREAIGNCFLLATVMSFFSLGSSLICYYFLNSNFCSFFMLINLAFYIPFALLLSYVSMREHLGTYIIYFFSQSVITLIISIGGIKQGLSIHSFFYGTFISLLPFLLLFSMLFKKYFSFNRGIFKEQITFALPILAHGIFYMLFFTIDRWIIKKYEGFEALGSYAILSRFGSIFQTLTLAVANAWPIICFNAHKENNPSLIIAKIINYFTLILCSGYLVAVLGAWWGLKTFLPQHSALIQFLPLFFLPILLLSLAQLFTVGCGVSRKSFYLPLATAAILITQVVALSLVKVHYNLWGILCIDSFLFSIYIAINYYATQLLSGNLINGQNISTILSITSLYTAPLMLGTNGYLSWTKSLCVLMTWPLALIATGLLSIELKAASTYLQKLFIRRGISFFKRYKSYKATAIDTILCLRTDICLEDSASAGGAAAQTLGVLQGWQSQCSYVIVASFSMGQVIKTQSNIIFHQIHVWPVSAAIARIFCSLIKRFKKPAENSYVMELNNLTPSPKNHSWLRKLRNHLGFARWRLECLFSNITFFIQLIPLFKRYNFKGIYQSYTVLNCTGLITGAFFKIPVIIEYNGSEVWTYQLDNKGRWFSLDWWAEIIEEITLHSADCLVVVSQALKETLLQQGIAPDRILVKPNGVDTEVYNTLPLLNSRTAIRTSLGVDHKIVFGFTGTFSHWHGVDIFEHVFPLVIKENPLIHFLLIGDGPQKSYLERAFEHQGLLNSSITFTGRVPQAKNSSYLAACDAFLCPARPEINGIRNFCSPIKLLEYLSMAKPIIAAGVEQINEILAPADSINKASKTFNDKALGILVNPEVAVEEFVKAILLIARLSPEQRQMLGANGRDKAIATYTWTARMQDIKQFTERSMVC